MVSTAHALTVNEKVSLLLLHLKTVIVLDEEFQKDYSGVGQIANNMFYT
jgi:hypothetical protein